MHSRKRNEDELRALCAHLYPEDGVDPREDKRKAAKSQSDSGRKAWQLCKQITKTLQLALGSLPNADVLVGVIVLRTTPAPNVGRMCVVISTPEHTNREEVAEIIEQHSARLRCEVAAAITRRRAPELVFEFVTEGADID